MSQAGRAVWFQLILSLALVAGSGLVAVGLSGFIADDLGNIFGKEFVAGDPPDHTYTVARCADLLADNPDVKTCRAAAAAHHFDEVVEYRLVAGVLGLPLLLLAFLARRRFSALTEPRLLPEGFGATVGCSLFGLAAALLLGTSTGSLLFGQSAGVGQNLSGGVVSSIAFVGYATALGRALRGGVARSSDRPPVST